MYCMLLVIFIVIIIGCVSVFNVSSNFYTSLMGNYTSNDYYFIKLYLQNYKQTELPSCMYNY